MVQQSMDKGKQKREEQSPFLPDLSVNKFDTNTYANCNTLDTNAFALKKPEWGQIDSHLAQSHFFFITTFSL